MYIRFSVKDNFGVVYFIDPTLLTAIDKMECIYRSANAASGNADCRIFANTRLQFDGSETLRAALVPLHYQPPLVT